MHSKLNMFIFLVILSTSLFIIILFNINYLLPDKSNNIETYTNVSISYKDFSAQKSYINYHPYKLFDDNGYRYKLYPEQAEKYLNSEGFKKIENAMTEYNIFSKDSSLDEILSNLKYNAYINSTPFGESIYINLSKDNLSIYFTPDGKNISYSYSNSLFSKETTEIKLDYESRQYYIEECKKFLSIFSTELAELFSPNIVQLDSYGVVYTMADTKNNIFIAYWIVENKPLGFKFGYK